MSPVQRKINAAAKSATDWIGSVSSLLVHTALFIVSFSLVLFGYDFDKILLTVTTVVSLEAIYLAIFIQMAINQQSQSLEGVEEDIDVIQERVEDIHEDVEDIHDDVEDIQKDVDEIQVEADEEEAIHQKHDVTLDKIEGALGEIIKEIEKMKGAK